MSDIFQAVGDSRTSERRHCPRQRVPFSCMQLDDDNGGIILDISERGLSMQAVTILTNDELPRMRFQLSQSQPWIETRGRIAWTSASMKTAGLEFIGLPEEARDQIKQWISWELQSNESVEGIAFSEKTEPMEDVPATDEPENVIPFREPKTMERVAENQNRYSIAEDAIEVPPSVEEVFQYSGVKSTASGATENARGTAAPLLTWSELEARFDRERKARKRSSSRTWGRLIGLAVATALLLSVLFFLAYHLQKSKYSQQQVETRPPAKPPEPSTDHPATPANSPVAPTPALDGPGFMLQVGAMTHKENADALAEALQRKNFPAFVSPHSTDRFYRVVVGPYSDVDSALRAKADLKEEGFESIRTPWNRLAEHPPHSAGSHGRSGR
jgi:septal ring-binding cell division protein DamX